VRNNIIFFLLLITAINVNAQTYLISTFNDSTITSCNGTLYDSGGSSGNYSSGESYVVTLIPNTAAYAHITFTSFNVGIGDQLEIFDGNDINAPLISIFNNGNSPVGYTIQPSFFNPMGRLTLRWTSISSNTGWAANLSCGAPCQTFNTILTSSDPPFTIENGIYFIDICPGDSVELIASANFPYNDYFYHQDSSTTTYNWNFGGNTYIAGQTVSAVFNNVQGYNAFIIASDTLGCHASQTTEVRVRVSTQPTFIGTESLDTIMCQYDTTSLFGSSQPSEWHITPSLSVAGITYLPDGSGVSYTSNLVFSGFPSGQMVMQSTDILKIFAEIEHSYLGDLNITIKCPNNSTVTLKSYPGGTSTFLGEPIDNNANQVPGLGYMYHWTPTGTTTMLNAAGSYTHTFTDVNSNTYTNHSYLPPSAPYPATSTASSPFPIVQYLPETPFNNFVGCPLNGSWSITVTDNLSIDNGYIFSWGIDFNPTVLPVAWGYTPIIDTTYWNVGGGDTTDYVSLSGGIQSLTYTMVDEAGCAYDTNINIYIYPSPDINLGNDTSICINDSITIRSGIDSVMASTYLWNTGSTIDSIMKKPINTSIYSLTATSIHNCVSFDSITVTLDSLPIIVITEDTLLCIGRDVDITASGGNEYIWNTGSVNSSINVSPTVNTVYLVTVTDSNNCVSNDSMKVDIAALPTITTSNDTTICDGTSTTIWASGGIFYYWDNGENTSNQIVDPVSEEIYKVVVVDNNTCIDSAEVKVEVLENPIVEIYSNLDTICEGGSVSLTSGGGMYYLWNDKYKGNTYKDSPKISTRYKLTAINTMNGIECYDTSSYFVYVEHCAVYNASAFTPNGDGLNDTYGPIGLVSSEATFEFIIYNKWGKMVFYTTEKNKRWDGKVNGVDAPQGVYSYVVRVSEPTIKPYELVGTVTLLR